MSIASKYPTLSANFLPLKPGCFLNGPYDVTLPSIPWWRTTTNNIILAYIHHNYIESNRKEVLKKN